MKRKSKLSIMAVVAVLGGTAVYAQDKYSLKSQDGIAFFEITENGSGHCAALNIYSAK